MNYLAICQKAARYSGTIDGTAPTTVAGQTGRLATLVALASSAWDLIQLENINSWRWLRTEFSYASLAAGTRKYSPASFNLTRHARWVTEEYALSIYLTATGVADEGAIDFIDWQLWRNRYDRGTIVQRRPTVAAISPANELCFGDTPDDAYTVRGEYIKSKQTLSDNSDTPECPSDYHEAVVWRTLMLLHEYDEAPAVPLQACRANYELYMGPMRASQLGEGRHGSGVRIAAPPLA